VRDRKASPKIYNTGHTNSANDPLVIKEHIP